MRGVELFVRRVGQGPPTVVLHGGPGAHHDYLLPGFDALADGRELIYYDQRGGGRSPVPRDVAVGWTEQVADLEALRDSVGARAADARGILVGRAAGAAVRRVPPWPGGPACAGVARAGVAGRAGPVRGRRSPGGTSIPRFRRPGGSSARAGSASGIRRPSSSASSSCRWPRTSSTPTRARELTPFRVTGRTQQEVWQSLGDFDLRPRLPELRDIPALVLHGEDDPIPIEAGADGGRS